MDHESKNRDGAREPGRTATEAESGERTVPEEGIEPTRTQDRAEGDPDVIDDALRQRQGREEAA